MPKRSSKPHDLNARAAAIVAESTSDAPRPDHEADKNPHAVALGRLGGVKGGKVRAERLSAERRSEIAKQAARVRWSKDPDG